MGLRVKGGGGAKGDFRDETEEGDEIIATAMVHGMCDQCRKYSDMS